jgi:hypothetical protein
MQRGTRRPYPKPKRFNYGVSYSLLTEELLTRKRKRADIVLSIKWLAFLVFKQLVYKKQLTAQNQ